MTISEHDHDHRSDTTGTRPTGRFVRTDAPQRGTTGGRNFPRNGLGEATDPVLHETPDRDTAADGAAHAATADGAPHGTAADPKATAGAAPAAPTAPASRSSSAAPAAAATAPAAARPAAATAPGGAGQERCGPGAPVLLPPDLAAQSARRLDRAMAGFVDDPGRAVREADEALDEAVRQLVENLEGRRTTLRDAWQGSTADGSSRTEDLRLALREYRDLLQHLLAV
ncbi:hypothetical protein Kpho02_71290 [Kitasatospora phosalacinea]|uniref:Uncharacterized protein n=1 Tax=Kitasatospora phosalacinea TaxID=2065 RepID=A0A9W6QI19_9ACTN|nr:hypothetical protein [Kitasatospora phosalacinea]GLW74832.1 hypothetical protein Kpho02_71290 [Kitasatospora phosalacinea]